VERVASDNLVGAAFPHVTARATDNMPALQLRDGTLCKDAMVARVLEPRGLTRAEARPAASYEPGDIVAFRKSEKGRPRAGIGSRVEGVDAETGP
jgi:hypothetical protein